MIIGEAHIDIITAEGEPFEADLRGRLFDIMDDWEERADKMTHPALQKTFREMIDQIDNAMHPPEED
jgi:hypothetical protein